MKLSTEGEKGASSCYSLPCLAIPRVFTLRFIPYLVAFILELLFVPFSTTSPRWNKDLYKFEGHTNKVT